MLDLTLIIVSTKIQISPSVNNIKRIFLMTIFDEPQIAKHVGIMLIELASDYLHMILLL